MITKPFDSKVEYISAIGQGTMGIGGYFQKDATKDAFLIELLKVGIGYGMNFIDTAPAYGKGHSEELVGKVVKYRRKAVFVATKVSPENLGYKGLIRSVDKSLLSLKSDYIDLLQIHWPNPRISLEETLSAMSELVRVGKVTFIGVSNFSLHKLREAHERFSKQGIASIQIEYNLFDRTVEKDILPYCKINNIALVAYSPLNRGKFILGDERTNLMASLTKKYRRTAAQIALRWLIRHDNVFVIPKAARLDHLKENADSADFELDQKDVDCIDRVFRQESIFIPTDAICVDKNGLEKFVPNVEDLAEALRNGETLKPIRVVLRRTKSKKFVYDLVEGKLRYWAWVNANNGRVPIPALVL